MCADVVIQGLHELTRTWIDFSHASRQELQTCQVSAFFNGPVLSMAYGRNLGPDPLIEVHPFPMDTGVTKNFAKVRRELPSVGWTQGRRGRSHGDARYGTMFDPQKLLHDAALRI